MTKSLNVGMKINRDVCSPHGDAIVKLQLQVLKYLLYTLLQQSHVTPSV